MIMEPGSRALRPSGMERHLGGRAAALVSACLVVLSACTGSAAKPHGVAETGPLRLTAFHSCGEELTALRSAAEASVSRYGLPELASSPDALAYPAAGWAHTGDVAAGDMRAPAAGAAGGAAAAPAEAAPAAPAHSGTNDYVAGVDEPDLVKTDGRRIVTVGDGMLQVIDAASRTITGRL